MAKVKNSPPPSFDPRLRYSIDEAVSLLRTSKPTLYAAINAGTISTITTGRRRFVPGTEIERLCAAPPRVATPAASGSVQQAAAA